MSLPASAASASFAAAAAAIVSLASFHFLCFSALSVSNMAVAFLVDSMIRSKTPLEPCRTVRELAAPASKPFRAASAARRMLSFSSVTCENLLEDSRARSLKRPKASAVLSEALLMEPSKVRKRSSCCAPCSFILSVVFWTRSQSFFNFSSCSMSRFTWSMTSLMKLECRTRRAAPSKVPAGGHGGANCPGLCKTLRLGPRSRQRALDCISGEGALQGRPTYRVTITVVLL
mmetsp:Transcript_64865/g.154883  ORF Transcript_64865/g.154883 Transcript_64865/m.154883 type:complete len:231 (-) Transcript_64865:23-715(-)